MRRWTLSAGVASAPVACLVIGVAGSARAATLDFTGTLEINVFGWRDGMGKAVYLTVPAAGSAQVTDDGNLHLLSFALAGGTFGPSTVTHFVLTTAVTGISSLRFTLSQNLSGSFSGISGGPPGGFAHGPASLSSSTAQIGGVVQLVTMSKVYTSLTGAFPEVPLTGVLTLHFVPEPETLLMLGLGVVALAAAGWRRSRR